MLIIIPQITPNLKKALNRQNKIKNPKTLVKNPTKNPSMKENLSSN